jgi:3-oxoacyl-[acyl-carrier protein] reductase
VKDKFGSDQIDILVNNAGVSGVIGSKIENITEDDWDYIMTTNVKSMFLVTKVTIVFILGNTQAVIPAMRANKFGRIINMTSIASYIASTISGVHYASSKVGCYGYHSS